MSRRQPSRSKVAISAGRDHIGYLTQIGSGSKAVFEAPDADHRLIGEFPTQTEAVRELLAVWIHQHDEARRARA